MSNDRTDVLNDNADKRTPYEKAVDALNNYKRSLENHVVNEKYSGALDNFETISSLNIPRPGETKGRVLDQLKKLASDLADEILRELEAHREEVSEEVLTEIFNAQQAISTITPDLIDPRFFLEWNQNIVHRLQNNMGLRTRLAMLFVANNFLNFDRILEGVETQMSEEDWNKLFSLLNFDRGSDEKEDPVARLTNASRELKQFMESKKIDEERVFKLLDNIATFSDEAMKLTDAFSSNYVLDLFFNHMTGISEGCGLVKLFYSQV